MAVSATSAKPSVHMFGTHFRHVYPPCNSPYARMKIPRLRTNHPHGRRADMPHVENAPRRRMGWKMTFILPQQYVTFFLRHYGMIRNISFDQLFVM